MVYKCFVYGCRTYTHPKNTTFSIPRDPELLQKWVEVLSPYGNGKVLQRKHRVCKAHFKPEDIVYFYVHNIKGTEVKIERGRPDLKQGAIPTVFSGDTRTRRKILSDEVADGKEQSIYLRNGDWVHKRKKSPAKPSNKSSRNTKRKRKTAVNRKGTRSKKQKNSTGKLNEEFIVEQPLLTVDSLNEITLIELPEPEVVNTDNKLQSTPKLPSVKSTDQKLPSICINWDALPLPEEIGSLLCDSVVPHLSSSSNFNFKSPKSCSPPRPTSPKLSLPTQSSPIPEYLSLEQFSEENLTTSDHEMTENQYESAENQYEETAENQYEESAENHYEETDENQYEETDENQYEETAETHYEETAENQYEEIAENQYEEIAENQYEEISENQYEESAENQYEESAETKYEETAENQYEESAENQYEESAENQYKESSENQYEEEGVDLSFQKFLLGLSDIQLPSPMWAWHTDYNNILFSLMSCGSPDNQVNPKVEKIVMYSDDMAPRIFLRGIEVIFPVSEQRSTSFEEINEILNQVDKLELCLGIDCAREDVISYSPDCEVVVESNRTPRCPSCKKQKPARRSKKRSLETDYSKTQSSRSTKSKRQSHE